MTLSVPVCQEKEILIDGDANDGAFDFCREVVCVINYKSMYISGVANR